MNIGKFLKTAILVVIFGSVLTVAISQHASNAPTLLATDSPRFPVGG